jgi:hypothetical protein
MMMKYLREVQFSPGNTTPLSEVTSSRIEQSDEVIPRALE